MINKKQLRLRILNTFCVLSLATLFGCYLQSKGEVFVKPAMSQEQGVAPDMYKDGQITRAIQLRDRWTGWALQHKTSLNSMLQSSSDNFDALNSLLSRLPSEPTSTDAGFGWQQLNDPETSELNVTGTWTWLPLAVGQVSGAILQTLTPEQIKDIPNSRKYVLDKWKGDFEKRKDVVVASGDKNDVRVSLWASGRITRAKLETVATNEAPQEVDEKEVLPSYSFLQATKSSSLILSDLEKQRRLAQARQIRELWRKWAQAHSPQLRAMLVSNGKDKRARDAVWSLIPAKEIDAGIDLSKFNIGQGNWSWQAVARDLKYSDDPKDAMRDAKREQVNRIKQSVNQQLDQNFENKSDIVISVFIGSGPNMMVWASGRITLDTLFQQSEVGKPSVFEGALEELEGPYKFLLEEKVD